jgi:glycosyltransferase involved in cell wall biosynthesis
VAWGLPPEKVVVVPYAVAEAQPAADPPRSIRNRFGYFGQLNPYKGVDVLLRAMDELEERVELHLSIHGANLDKQAEPWREQLEALLAVERGTVTVAGSYDHDALGSLMALVDWVVVPSIWRETGPIVVLEAFRAGRPVICSDIGGMAEKVEDGVNGLHFHRGDAAHLAQVIERAAQSPQLWDELRARIPSHPASLESNVAELTEIYERLLSPEAASESVTVTPPPPHTGQPSRR